MSTTPSAVTRPAPQHSPVVRGIIRTLLVLAALVSCVGFYWFCSLVVFGSGSCGEPFDRAAADRGRLMILGAGVVLLAAWLVPTVLVRRRARVRLASFLTGVVSLVVVYCVAMTMSESVYRNGWCF